MEKVNEEKTKLTPVIDNFESAVSLWRKHFKNFILVYWQGLKYALIPIAVVVLMDVIGERADSVSGGALFSYALVSTLAYLLAFYFILRSQISLFLYIKYEYKGNPEKLFAESKKCFWPYLGLSLLTAILVLLWALLLIVPGIIYGVLYSLAVYVFFVEDKRGMSALRRSKELVSGYFWPVFGRIVFLMFILLIFTSIIGLPGTPFDKGSDAYKSWELVMQILNVIVSPIIIIFFYNIYKNLVKIKGNK